VDLAQAWWEVCGNALRDFIKKRMDGGMPADQAKNVPWSEKRTLRRSPKKRDDMVASLEVLRSTWRTKADATGTPVWTKDADQAVDLLIKEIQAGFYEGKDQLWVLTNCVLLVLYYRGHKPSPFMRRAKAGCGNS
jgi:hypothetical protein